MEQRNELLINITDTEPNREMGSLEELKQSLQDVGLINPLTIDKNGKLLAGRRRYKAMIELGWEECPVVVLDPQDDLEALMISFYENVVRKPLTDPENRRMIAEIDEKMREKFGSKVPGVRDDSSLESNELKWSDEKTGEKLGISQATVTLSKQAEAHVGEHPELAAAKTPEILDHKKKEDLIAQHPENEQKYLEKKAKELSYPELKEITQCGTEIEKKIEALPDSEKKQELQKKYHNPYNKFETSQDQADKDIRAALGLTALAIREAYDEMLHDMDRWNTKYPELVAEFAHFVALHGEIEEHKKKVPTLKRVDFPLEQFGNKEIADDYATQRSGHCSGRTTIDGREIWILYVSEEHYENAVKRASYVNIDETIKRDLTKAMALTEKERMEQGLTWRDIMKKYGIGSSKIARLKNEIE